MEYKHVNHEHQGVKMLLELEIDETGELNDITAIVVGTVDVSNIVSEELKNKLFHIYSEEAIG
jgi:hypothetical protein